MTKPTKKKSHDVMLEGGDVEGAQAEAQQVLANEPGNRKALLTLAKIATFAGDFEKAALMAARAALIAEDGESLLVQAAIAARTRSYDDTQALYQKALAKAPSAAAHYGLGMLYMSADQFVLASEQLKLAVEFDPKEAEIQLQLARALLASDRLQEALPHLKAALKLEPSRPEPYDLAVTVLLEFGFVKEAESVLRDGLVVMPNQPLLRSRLCDVLVVKGAPGDALDITLELAKQHPDNADIVVNAARLLGATGAKDTARKILSELNEKGLASSQSRELEGQLFEADGLVSDAIVAYVEAAKADYRGWRALNNLAHLMMRKEDGDVNENVGAAREALEEALRRAPARLEPMLNLALVAAREKKTDEAKALAKEVATKASPRTQKDLLDQAKRLLEKL